MIPTNRIPTHPGIILLNEFLEPKDMSMTDLAKAMGIGHSLIVMIVKGKRNITAKTAIKLAKVFKTTAEFWLSLQAHYDIGVAMMNETKQ